MSNYGPWSVKGSDERAREAAREAAREEGLTISEYINRMLKMETGSAGGSVSGTPPAARDEESPRYARGGGGSGGDGEYPGSAAAIQDLLRRLEAVEARSAVALSGIDRSILGLTERLEDAHRKADGISTNYDGVLDDIRTTHDALKTKVDSLEGSGGGRGDVKALKSLERALGKLASHVYEETSRQKDGTADVRKRVETGLEDIGSRLSGVEGRIDKTLDEAAERLARKVEQAELRTEGATKHLSGRFSELETRVAERLAHADTVAKRVDAVETSTSGSISSVESLVEALQARLDRAETATNDALDNVDQTYTALSARVSELADKALPDTAAMLREHFESRFKGLSEELRSSIDTTRQQLAREIEDAAGKAAKHEQVDAVRTSVANLSEAVDRKDVNTQAALGTMRQDLELSGKTSRVALEELSRHVDTNWTASQAALDTLRQRFDSRDTVSVKTLEDLRERMDARQNELAEKIEAVSERAVPLATVEAIQQAVGAIRQRLVSNEKTSSETLEKVSERIARVSEFLGNRLKQVESRDYAAQIEAVRADMQTLSADVKRQMESSGGQTDEMIEQISAEMKRMAEHFESRVDESEKRSATAIEQVGEQVSGVAQRLHARQDRSFRELEESLEAERKTQQKRLSDALNGVSDRIEEMQERSNTSLSPVQKAIASLATRLEAVEDGSSGKSRKSRKASAPDAEHSDEALRDFLSDDVPAKPAQPAKPARAANRDEFEAGLPFLEELDDGSPPFNAGGAYEYETELPDEDGGRDPFASFDDFDESGHETRDSDVFIEERPRADDSWDVSGSDEFGGRGSRRSGGGDDYISRARRAALDASEVAPTKAGKGSKASRKKSPKAASQPKKSGKFPLLAAVSIAALATAGAGAWVVMNNMQTEAPRPTVQTRDTLSLAAAEPAASEAIAEDGEAASADNGAADTSGTAPASDGRAETVNSVQAPESDADLEEALFAEDAAPDVEASLSGISDPSDTSPPPAQADTQPSLASVEPIPEAPSMESAAVGGDAVAQYLVGEQALEAGDYTSGPTMIRRAAEQGLAAAQYRFAKLHESGLGVPRDLEMARQWTEQAASGGNVKAMHDLAVYYAEGEGGPQTYTGAAEWFRKAADYGVTDSQYNLAVLYEAGLGVSENPTEALYWYAVAASQGDSGAPAKVEELSSAIGPEAASRARSMAADWSPARPERLPNGIFPAQSWQGAVSAEQVSGVQKALAALGHEPGPADGMMGAGTLAAIRNYQRENGMEETGNVTPELIDSLNARIRDARS
ncbi:peptidoglycan-binding protein [Henriciella marina]|uniref:peptidoglycan-binding protein n=1 Tax=Henriciella marina TaxID=453851 RepID=UPI000373364E|nr:peptidoglycan-binding protein [Henriciella marina]